MWETGEVCSSDGVGMCVGENGTTHRMMGEKATNIDMEL